jgi:hypothetical protein
VLERKPVHRQAKQCKNCHVPHRWTAR